MKIKQNGKRLDYSYHGVSEENLHFNLYWDFKKKRRFPRHQVRRLLRVEGKKGKLPSPLNPHCCLACNTQATWPRTRELEAHRVL